MEHAASPRQALPKLLHVLHNPEAAKGRSVKVPNFDGTYVSVPNFFGIHNISFFKFLPDLKYLT